MFILLKFFIPRPPATVENGKARKSLDHATPGVSVLTFGTGLLDIRRGLTFVRKIIKKFEISGVFGPIFELLDCDEKIFIAVEVTAQNRCLQGQLFVEIWILPQDLPVMMLGLYYIGS
ncbi:hypothetical protein M9H77_17021 [Catharanthus roseus]|uniref:Uncharacterized protein n=1 Tax=Catharanthus roseus TaxID=4058 RepID=A0ACC0B3F9_CATRO|nr:hypothetical protein M9H77_17021 [Catharanthus roseus]